MAPTSLYAESSPITSSLDNTLFEELSSYILVYNTDMNAN